MSEIRSQATPARDELAALILAEPNSWRLNRDNLATRILADGWLKPRTVNSAAELDALPVNSVVVDASDTPRTKRYGDSHMGAGWTNAGRSPLSSRELADGRPMRVLFTPGDAG